MTDLSNIIHILPPMRAGEDLFSALEVLPKYDESICTAEVPVRLMAHSDLYRICDHACFRIFQYGSLLDGMGAGHAVFRPVHHWKNNLWQGDVTIWNSRNVQKLHCGGSSAKQTCLCRAVLNRNIQQ